MNQKLRQLLDAVEKPGRLDEAARNEIAGKVNEVQQELENIANELEQKQSLAQAKESAIETALEMVRSRSLAMRQSSELQEIVCIVLSHVIDLGINVDSASLIVLPAETNLMEFWIAAPGQHYSTYFSIPYFDHTTIGGHFMKARESGLNFTTSYTGEEKNEQWKYLFENSDLRYLPAERKNFLLETTAYTVSVAFTKNTALQFLRYNNDVFSEPENKVFQRFANVVEQAYVRFLDLQKAEAQAKEAQIELGLERVRARAMAMQNSEELKELIGSVFVELTKLDFVLTRCVIMIFDLKTNSSTWWMANSETPSEPIGLFVQYHELVPYQADLKAWHERKLKWVFRLDGEVKKTWDNYIFSETGLSQLPALVIAGMKAPEQVYLNASFTSFGNLTLATLEALSGEHFDILLRFAKVFDLTYTRFNDLKQAEAQAKEAKIEASLERIRAKAMAMHHSDELDEVLAVLFEQFDVLGIFPMSTHMTLIDIANNRFTFRETGKKGRRSFGEQVVPIDSMAIWKDAADTWRTSEPRALNRLHFPKEILPQVWQVFHESFASMPEDARLTPQDYPDGIYHTAGNCRFGYIGMNQTRKATEEEEEIVLKFATEFGRFYQRFLDLKKAEAQAREARIETALERVRAKAMAMHNSQDLADTIGVFYNELQSFSITPRRCGVGLLDRESRVGDLFTWNTAADGESLELIGRMKMEGHPVLNKIYEGWLTQTEYRPVLCGSEIKEYYEIVRPQIAFPDHIDDEVQYGYFFFFSEGGVYAWTEKEMHEEEVQIYRRFTSVLSLTYKRHKDLQKAEAQAREAQIEAALEKVRAVAMSMMKSEEFPAVCESIYRQLVQIGFEEIRSVQINVLDDKAKKFLNNEYSDGLLRKIFKIDYGSHPMIDGFIEEVRNAKDELLIRTITGAAMDDWRNYLYNTLGQEHEPMLDKADTLSYYAYSIGEGTLTISTFKPLGTEQLLIVQRLRNVFGLSYKRYKDISLAEAQAREAQIETALERVRAIAMSMMKSDELMAICEVVFKQLQSLGFADVRAAQIYIRNDAAEKFLNYDYSDVTGADVIEVSYNSHPNTRRIYDVIKNAGDALIDNVIRKEELEAWKSYLYDTLKQPPEQSLDKATELHYYLYSIGTGAFGICTFKTMSPEELQILKRFRNVFSLSYSRYTDITQAEAQAREAKIEAALERVRSRTLAMQKSGELAEAAAVLFKQLIGLGSAPNRLYIGIIDDEKAIIEFWVTDEDGTKVSTMYSGDAAKNSAMKQMFDGWAEQKKHLVIDLHGDELVEYFRYLGDDLHVPFKNAHLQKRRLQYLAYFSKGFIGIASPDEQPPETLELLERFAYVFNLTFTRFNDLKLGEAHATQAAEDLIKLQTEKKRAEDALVELRAAQKQLIQSEKMASLGELTAGIAHEIQNPLNFVNNFSEVSKELLEEMSEALSTGDIINAKEIANGVMENLAKISHHGKRADAIVKGMLQHSKSSAAVKELTDINTLTDEYVRLCYHGLRAKDKSFNATITTDFDNSIDAVNVIAQDIGRVVLNVLTNAFYAVNEKRKTRAVGYEPIVSIATKKYNGEIVIRIKDNGNGIPPDIVDKIFQPFFTTKPTGQGTGLGLSLSYDIIKAHEGGITLETAHGEGTTFVIHLPLK
jgi:signal transduction histidine kinase